MPRAEQVLPKYLQIANHVRDRILAGDLPAGAEVASERELAADWGVARPTASKALAELRRLGLVESSRGSGTFVTAPPMAKRAAERFEHARADGAVYPPHEHARIIEAAVVPAPDRVREGLHLAPGAQAVRRQRITFEGEQPNEMSTSWFDPVISARGRRLLEKDRILEGTTAYVESVTGRAATMAEERESARRATAEEASLLGLRKTAAVLVTEHRVLDAKGDPLEWAESVSPEGRWTPLRRYRLRP